MRLSHLVSLVNARLSALLSVASTLQMLSQTAQLEFSFPMNHLENLVKILVSAYSSQLYPALDAMLCPRMYIIKSRVYSLTEQLS